MATVKAKEKEMKEEKEAERQVCIFHSRTLLDTKSSTMSFVPLLTKSTEKGTNSQGQASCEGRKGAV
jgi:hypothetical protein